MRDAIVVGLLAGILVLCGIIAFPQYESVFRSTGDRTMRGTFYSRASCEADIAQYPGVMFCRAE